MSKSKNQRTSTLRGLPKSPTGVQGLDEITGGGLPTGRPTLVCGTAGCGKTLFAVEFLVRGIVDHGEPGVFMTFEETGEEISRNVRSLGFDLKKLVRQKKLALDYVHVERSEIDETGDYDLEGLFIRLEHAIQSVQAKRVVIDTIEALFSGLSNAAILRAELRRLFRWLKDKGVTVVITGERGDGALTRHGIEEYVSDCVILLDHRVIDEISTRRLRIVKYRGTHHGTNEYPFLIERDGISVLPITSLQLDHAVQGDERLPTGVGELDTMLQGGVHRGCSVLISGTAGAGKTSFAASFVDAACTRGERCLYFAFEESPAQIARNMRSVGLDLKTWENRGLLQVCAARPTLVGLEAHLGVMQRDIRDFKPDVVVIDPINNLTSVGSVREVKAMLVRIIDFLKSQGITAVFTSLTPGGDSTEQTDVGISSLIDAWLLLADTETGGERNRTLYIMKARGIAHSNQVREFLITDQGIQLVKPYLGPEGVLTGSARLAQEAREQSERHAREHELQRVQQEIDRKRKLLEIRIESLRAEFEADEEQLHRQIDQHRGRDLHATALRDALARSRKVFSTDNHQGNTARKKKGRP